MEDDKSANPKQPGAYNIRSDPVYKAVIEEVRELFKRYSDQIGEKLDHVRGGEGISVTIKVGEEERTIPLAKSIEYIVEIVRKAQKGQQDLKDDVFKVMEPVARRLKFLESLFGYDTKELPEPGEVIGEHGSVRQLVSSLLGENKKLREDLEYDRAQYLSVLSKLAERLGDEEAIRHVREFKGRIEGRYNITENQDSIDETLKESEVVSDGEMVIEVIEPPQNQAAEQALSEADIGEETSEDLEPKNPVNGARPDEKAEDDPPF